MTRTTSIGWRIGHALREPTRFTDLMAIISHTDKLSRVLRKLVADGLARQHNDRRYELTQVGRAWIAAAEPLLRWCEQHPRNHPPMRRGNDPVGFNHNTGARP